MTSFMKNKYLIIQLTLLVMSVATSCTLHEEPHRTSSGELGVDPTEVSLNVDIALNVELPGSGEKIFQIPDTLMHRFIVEAYNRDREVVDREVFYDADLRATSFSISANMRLHAQAYRIVVWSDYVRVSDPESQLFYNAASLTPVLNNGGYRGNTDAKDAFSGYSDIDLRKYAGEWNPKVETDVRLRRPMGRYQLVSTDVESFRRRLAEGSVAGESFTARVKYSGYLAVGYNCYDALRKHMLNYMSFNTPLKLNDDATEISIGFDYIFISPDDKLEVPVEVEVVNEKNETVSRSMLTLPLQQDRNVIVKGRFLTSTAEGGVDVDPGYDGYFTVDIGPLTPQ